MCRVNADVFPGSLNSNNDIVVAMIVADAVKLTQSGLSDTDGDSQSVNRMTLFSLSQTNYHSALNIKLLEPLAQGASRFEKSLTPPKSTGPQFFSNDVIPSKTVVDIKTLK